MFGLDTAIVELGLAIAKPIASFTDNEIDDKIVEAIDLITDGEYVNAMAILAELVDPDDEK